MAAAFVATLLAVALLWPRLPVVHQDEYLPIFPLVWYTKTPDARPDDLGVWVRSFADGRLLVPLRAYHYIGSSKGLVWAALGLPTEPRPYRATNAVGLALLVAVLAWAAWWFSGRSALGTALAVAFLVGDVSFLVLGVTDEGPILIHLLLATVLAVLLASLGRHARWWLAAPIALVVTLGVWDRLNFGWFAAAGLVGCAAAAPVVRPRRRAVGMLLVAAVGTAAGFVPIWWLIPGYLDWAWTGVEGGIPLADVPRLLAHAGAMLDLLDPYAAYHRYANVAAGQRDLPWVAYRWLFVALGAGAVTGLAVRGLRRRDPALLFLAGFTAALAAAIVGTHQAWASHHVVVVKPFVYLAVAALVGGAARVRAVAVALGVLAAAFAALGGLGLARLGSAPPVTGVYDVSRNAEEAWRAAAASRVRRVYALDWGAYFPGVVNSRPDQRWESEEAKDPPALRRLYHGRAEPIGLLFRAGGPHAWILAAAARGRLLRSIRTERFDRHAGEHWVFMEVDPTPARSPSRSRLGAE